MRLFLFSVILFFVMLPTAGQSITDSVFVIGHVTVKGTRQHVNRIMGSKVSTIAPTVLKNNQTRNMAELLTDHSLVHIKSMGQGGLSTSSFRGTGANHTQVNWNGININSSMMGNFDFSQFPSFFTDQVTLNHGSSDTRSGTGALGGSINLDNRLSVNDSSGVMAFMETASFNTWSAAASTLYGKGKTRLRTRLFGQMSDNNFRYLNKVLQKDPFEERREGAEYQQAGLMQECYSQLENGQSLTSTLWVNLYQRNLPQPVMVNKKQDESENMGNLRFFTGWRKQNEKSTLELKGAWLMDYYFYRSTDPDYSIGNESSENWSHAAILKSDYNRSLGDNITLLASANYRFDLVKAQNYEREQVTRHTLSLQSRVEWQAAERLRLKVQAMAEQNDHLLMPTFSGGVDYQLIPVYLTLSANVARNYHYPTLNDLYWSRLGNPDLRPEKGMAYDLAFRVNIPGNRIRFHGEVSGYYMNITDWIIWLRKRDGGYADWTPSNLNKVRSTGIEVMTETNFKTGAVRHRLNLNYGLASALNKTKAFANDRSYNKQIPYVPIHKANMRYYAELKRWHVSYGISYTGKRYTTTDHSYSTEAYAVHDVEAGMRINRWLKVRTRVNNLWDTYYESTQYFPMPLRSYAVALVVNL